MVTPTLGDVPGKAAIKIIRGDVFDPTMVFKRAGVVVDISTWTAELKGRDGTTDDLILNLSEGFGITLGIDGTIAFLIDEATTRAFVSGTGSFDFSLNEPGVGQKTKLRGSYNIDDDVNPTP